MKKLLFVFTLIFPMVFLAQTSRDINTVIQKTIDLHALKKFYNEAEMSGETPIIIINDERIPNNLIVFKFNKRVKILSHEELETFKKIYSGNLDSYFVFEVLEFKDDVATIKATFRKSDKIAINVSMKKENQKWLVKESSAG